MTARAARKPLVEAGVVRLALTAVAATILFLAANYGLNALLAGVDKAPVRQHLSEAFADGALGIVKSRSVDSGMGVHQTNDCLIFDMAARESTDDMLYVFAAERTSTDRKIASGNCERLRDWLAADPTQTFGANWYLRYIHGYRAVAIGMLEIFPVDTTRAILKTASYGSLLLATLLPLGIALRRYGGLRGALGSNFAGYALIAFSLLVFFGLPYFGQSISHAPAIVTLALFLIGWTLLDAARRLTRANAIYLTIGFALFTGYFEFLTGYVPVGCAVLIALAAIGWGEAKDVTAGRLIGRLALLEVAFVGTVAALFILNTLATATFSLEGRDAVTSFATGLTTRMSQTVPGEAATGAHAVTLADLGGALVKELGHLSVLTQPVVAFILLLAVGLSLAAAYDAIFQKRPPAARLAVAMAALSFAPVALWIMAFQNHTLVHAAFMVRILAVVPMAGLVGVWAWRRSAAAEPRETSQPAAPALST